MPDVNWYKFSSGMYNNNSERPCERCSKVAAQEIICTDCIGELLETYDHRISWKMALEIEREEQRGEGLSIQIQ